jgi:hypothetical protein
MKQSPYENPLSGHDIPNEESRTLKGVGPAGPALQLPDITPTKIGLGPSDIELALDRALADLDGPGHGFTGTDAPAIKDFEPDVGPPSSGRLAPIRDIRTVAATLDNLNVDLPAPAAIAPCITKSSSFLTGGVPAKSPGATEDSGPQTKRGLGPTTPPPAPKI